ncbi:MAG: hypothetical protein LUF30_02405 [Lachnospiraceae bacterium]|nr:hypothetical protein [Lachnospiraceae bacterium]
MFNYDDEYTYESRPPRGRNAMATAALALGILSLVLCSFIYAALPCGAMAIICAILSRGKGKMYGRSKAGLIFGIAGIIATIVVTVSAFVYVLTTDSGRSYLEYYYRIYSGDLDFDLDEALEEYFPFLFGSGEDNTDNSDENGSGNSQYGGSDDTVGNDSGNSGSDSGNSGDSGSGDDSGSGGLGGSGGSAGNGSGGNSGNSGSDSAEGGFI